MGHLVQEWQMEGNENAKLNMKTEKKDETTGMQNK
jgi:hypothetical protein